MDNKIKEILKNKLRKYSEYSDLKAEKVIVEISNQNKFESTTKNTLDLDEYLLNLGIKSEHISDNLEIRQFNFERFNYFLLFSNDLFIGFIKTLISGAKIDIEDIKFDTRTSFSGIFVIKYLKNILEQNKNIHFINLEHKYFNYELKQLFEIEGFKSMGDFLQYIKQNK